jgi:5,10-methenyltetrahydromethanopterin hydrogenase
MVDIGYSGTPLAKKLGLKPRMKVLTVHAPTEYDSWLGELPDDVKLVTKAKPPIDAAHIFVTESLEMDALLSKLRNELKQDGFVWVSWYKKSAKMQTDITEDVIREIALPLGFVDVKVCAVSEQWSGLKLVIRKSDRK